MELGKILDSTPEPSLVPVLGKYKDDSGEYVLPVPMTESQRTLTDQVVSLHYSDILKLFETDESVMHESLETLFVNSQLVATHPYLLVEQYEPHNILLKEVPSQLARESGKFKVLADIIDLIKDDRKHVALVCRPGKTMDLIEAYILGKFVNYRRYSGSYLREPSGEEDEFSVVHLIPSSNLDPSFVENKFDFVIAFDQSFSKTEPHVAKILKSHTKPPAPLPIVRLVPLNSVEHISLKFSEDPTGDFLKKVLAAVVCLRWSVGSIPADLKPIYHKHLEPLADWFHNPTSPWQLPKLPQVEEYSSSDVEESLLKEWEDEDQKESPTDDQIGKGANGYYKTKRLKRETDYVSDDRNTENDDELVPYQTLMTHQLVRKINQLITHNSQLKAALESYKSTSSRRQETYEELVEEMGTKVQAIDELENRLRFTERKVERLTTERERAVEKTDRVTQELLTTRETIQNGPPETAKLDEQRRRIEELETELKKTNDKLESRNRENEYMREEYQKASSAAADAHAQIKTLKEENAELEKRADGEAIRLRSLTFDEERSTKDDQIKELTSKLELLEEHLRRMMDSEKQQVGRSRLASRANSSSKMSRTNSPITDTNTNNGKVK